MLPKTQKDKSVPTNRLTGKKVPAPDAGGSKASTPTRQMPSYNNANTEWHCRVNDALDKIKAEFGEDIMSQDALRKEDGCLAMPIDWELLKERMGTSANNKVILSGGGNVLWGSPTSSLTPNVGINTKAVETFIKNTWPSGGVAEPLNIPIDFLASEPNMQKGSLVRVSPEEPQQALVIHVGARLLAGADADDKRAWKACLLSGSVRFIRLGTSDEQFFWVTNARRKVKDAAAAMVHLATQVICAT